MPFRTRGLRVAFKTLDQFGPGLGARWVMKIWFTVPRIPDSARRERVALPAGISFEVEVDGRQIRGTTWGRGPTVYLVHGWAGWGLQLAAFIPPLLAAGFRVVSYDAPAHGDSGPGRLGGRATDLHEMSEALEAVVDAQGPAYGIIAHSLGAGAVSQAMRNGLNAQRLVFVSATKEFEHTIGLFERALGFGARTRAAIHRRFEARFGHPVAAYDLATVFARIRGLPPLLAIHDMSDHETPYQGSAALVADWPDSRLELTEGLGHRKILGDNTTISRAVSFLSTRTESSPPVGLTRP